MDEEGKEFDTVKRMVEGIKDEADRTLPILWDKWKHASNEGVLHRGIKACIQVDKQA
ncbi:MAG: hypothetical protein QME64_01030 [bacterium]|nr:hypothetical protein [bacterium]